MKQNGNRAFLSGNAAIARGAWEAGVKFASAYPGTPSTEILEFLGTYKEIDAQWAVNEKTAMETVNSGSAATLSPTCFIPQKLRFPARHAPKALSIATFSFGAHSA